jgi:hypothetical protein
VIPLARWRGGGPAADPPAPFVVGVGRSGTTLLRLMLDAHPALAIPAETHFLPALIDRAEAGGGREELLAEILSARGWADFGLRPEALRERVAALDGGDAATVARSFYGLYAQTRGKSRWGDKTPAYVRRMRAIGDLLGEARFVHLIRDGRDVALSRRRRGMGAAKPIADAAHLWRRRIEDARRAARRLCGRYLELRYEDLVADPEPALRRACELVELDFDAEMLRYHEGAPGRLAEMSGDLPAAGRRRARSGEERMAAHALASTPPASDRVGGWRQGMSARERAEFEAVAGDLLADLGYDVAS